MPPLTDNLQSPPKNGHPPILNGNGTNGHSNDLVEEFQGPGFRFVRAFLLVILMLVGILLILAGFLSWYFSMDVTVEGKGVIEPLHRYLVKAEITGIIKQIHVQTGQQVEAGDLLVTLDDTEWRAELGKIEADLQVNQSQMREIEVVMQQNRIIRQAEVTQARVGVERMRLELERVVAEQTLYSNGTNLHRKPIEELVPVRLAKAMLNQQEAGLALVQQHLWLASEPSQEIATLEKLCGKLEQGRNLLQKRLLHSMIRAPEAGRVLTDDLKYRQGDRIQAGEVVLEMAEVGEWQARIMVQEIDIPKVKEGQVVRLYVNAFPHMEYKIFKGEVTEVPSVPESVMAAGNVVIYPIKVAIQDAQVTDEKRVYSLTYGMNLEAKIIIEQGRIIELMWQKLLRGTGKIGKHDFHFTTDELSFFSSKGTKYKYANLNNAPQESGTHAKSTLQE
jgi:multidrug resistance efflux pump